MAVGRPVWNRDTLMGIAGALVLVGAMLGVFVYERGQFHEYDVTWSAAAGDPQTADGTLQQGNSRGHDFTLNATDLSRVDVSLSWTDDVGEPDTFRVDLLGPDGLTATPQEDTSGNLRISMGVAEQPSITSATGRTETDALAQVTGQPSAMGQGEWTVTVTLVAAPGQVGPAGLELAADGANSYRVSLVPSWWAPTLQER